jgi:hypothetical protein
MDPEHTTIDCRQGYRIMPGTHGGWMVMEDYRNDNGRLPLIAAFSTYGAMLEWLKACHDATFKTPSEPA